MFIFLTGMPGSGKSYWLTPLAQALGYSPLDMDAEIEAQQGKRIATLFECYGESHFRALERTLLDSLLLRQDQNWVIATGGGTPCFFDNLEQMKASGIVVYLKKDLTAIIADLAGSHSQRPLLEGAVKKTGMLQALLSRREHIYEQAQLIIDASRLTLPIFVARLKPFLTS
jgi:shikimate kinase